MMAFKSAATAGFTAMLFAQHSQGQNIFGLKREVNECKSAEEEAAELQRIMQSENGGLPPDPEEMQEMLRRARGQQNKRPPQFQRLNLPIKMMTMFKPCDGFSFAFAVPFSQRFQSSLSWDFSNKKPADFELTAMLAGGGNMMNEDEMSFVNATMGSGGRVNLQGQTPLALGVKLSTEIEMPAPDPNMVFTMFSLQRDFHNCHLQYQYMQAHSISYMQYITDNIVGGFQATYVVRKQLPNLSAYAL